jgi:hypothetical protein
MRNLFAITASSLIILAALTEGDLRWWAVVVGLACIWLLRLAVEQERRVEQFDMQHHLIQEAITVLEASGADAPVLPRAPRAQGGEGDQQTHP